MYVAPVFVGSRPPGPVPNMLPAPPMAPAPRIGLRRPLLLFIPAPGPPIPKRPLPRRSYGPERLPPYRPPPRRMAPGLWREEGSPEAAVALDIAIPPPTPHPPGWPAAVMNPGNPAAEGARPWKATPAGIGPVPFPPNPKGIFARWNPRGVPAGM